MKPMLIEKRIPKKKPTAKKNLSSTKNEVPKKSTTKTKTTKTNGSDAARRNEMPKKLKLKKNDDADTSRVMDKCTQNSESFSCKLGSSNVSSTSQMKDKNPGISKSSRSNVNQDISQSSSEQKKKLKRAVENKPEEKEVILSSSPDLYGKPNDILQRILDGTETMENRKRAETSTIMTLESIPDKEQDAKENTKQSQKSLSSCNEEQGDDYEGEVEEEHELLEVDDVDEVEEEPMDHAPLDLSSRGEKSKHVEMSLSEGEISFEAAINSTTFQNYEEEVNDEDNNSNEGLLTQLENQLRSKDAEDDPVNEENENDLVSDNDFSKVADDLRQLNPSASTEDSESQGWKYFHVPPVTKKKEKKSKFKEPSLDETLSLPLQQLVKAPGFEDIDKVIKTKGQLPFVLLYKQMFGEHKWRIPPIQVFHDYSGKLEIKIIKGLLSCGTVLVRSHTRGKVGTMILRCDDLELLTDFQDYIKHDSMSNFAFTIVPMDCFPRWEKITILLRETFRTLEEEMIASCLFLRNPNLAGTLRLFRSRRYGSEYRTKVGNNSMEGWRLVTLEANSVFMDSLQSFPRDYKFTLIGGFVEIRSESSKRANRSTSFSRGASRGRTFGRGGKRRAATGGAEGNQRDLESSDDSDSNSSENQRNKWRLPETYAQAAVDFKKREKMAKRNQYKRKKFEGKRGYHGERGFGNE